MTKEFRKETYKKIPPYSKKKMTSGESWIWPEVEN
jgi:hypothetical protein